MSEVVVRDARAADLETLRALMDRSIAELQKGFLTEAQIVASRRFMGLDTQLVADGDYVVAEIDGVAVGCGGWSRRATLFGGDDSLVARTPDLLVPGRDPARVRAMYTDPAHARRGIGRRILETCEDAAARAGFTEVVLMATLSGEPLYRAMGYRVIEPVVEVADGVAVPLIRMGKALALRTEP